MAKASNLTTSQRRDAVLALLPREEPAGHLARRWGVSEATLYRWRDEFVAGGEAALASRRGGADARDREIQELRARLAERDKVIGELMVANRILRTCLKSRFRARDAGRFQPVSRVLKHALEKTSERSR